jgi:type II secretory pathway pseudopilin PulG
MTIESLRATLDKLKATTSTITAEQSAEIEVREAIAAENARLAEEAAKLRQLAIDQAVDEAGGLKGREVLDLNDAGFFLVKAPSKPAYLVYQGKVEKNTKSSTDDATLAQDCIEAHYVAKTVDGVTTYVLSTSKPRDTFDAYPLAPTSIGNVGLRLAGFKIQAEAKRGR